MCGVSQVFAVDWVFMAHIARGGVKILAACARIWVQQHRWMWKSLQNQAQAIFPLFVRSEESALEMRNVPEVTSMRSPGTLDHCLPKFSFVWDFVLPFVWRRPLHFRNSNESLENLHEWKRAHLSSLTRDSAIAGLHARRVRCIPLFQRSRRCAWLAPLPSVKNLGCLPISFRRCKSCNKPQSPTKWNETISESARQDRPPTRIGTRQNLEAWPQIWRARNQSLGTRPRGSESCKIWLWVNLG